MGTLANSEDRDELPHNMAFHQSLNHDKLISREKLQFYLEIMTCDPSNYKMDLPKIIYKTRRKNPLVYKGLGLMDMKIVEILQSKILLICEYERSQLMRLWYSKVPL